MFFLQHLRPGVYGDRVKVDVDAEVRHYAKEIGLSDEATEQAVAEANLLVKKRREELRRGL